jgi:hypothetical protein
MIKLKRLLFLLSIIAVAGPPPFARADWDFYGMRFRANALMLFQPSGGSLFTSQLNWNPEVQVNDRFFLQTTIGAAIMNGSRGSRFLAYSYQGLFKFYLRKRLALEWGGGIENWGENNGGINPVLSGHLVIDFPKSYKKMKYMFVGYSRYYLPFNPTSEYKIGVVFKLFK